jgi:hypothetical protein
MHTLHSFLLIDIVKMFPVLQFSAADLKAAQIFGQKTICKYITSDLAPQIADYFAYNYSPCSGSLILH